MICAIDQFAFYVEISYDLEWCMALCCVVTLCLVDILHHLCLFLTHSLSSTLLLSSVAIYLYHDIFLFVCFFIHFCLCVVLLHNNCYASFWFIAVFPLKIRFFLLQHSMAFIVHNLWIVHSNNDNSNSSKCFL